MKLSSIELQGMTVEIIPMGMEHVEPLYEAGRDPNIWAYMPMRVQTRDDMRRLVEEAVRNRDEGQEYDGYVRDSVYFSILDVEWPFVRQRLEMFMIQPPSSYFDT